MLSKSEVRARYERDLATAARCLRNAASIAEDARDYNTWEELSAVANLCHAYLIDSAQRLPGRARDSSMRTSAAYASVHACVSGTLLRVPADSPPEPRLV